jgi:flagella basal body P-ring formation protein FlgA
VAGVGRQAAAGHGSGLAGILGGGVAGHEPEKSAHRHPVPDLLRHPAAYSPSVALISLPLLRAPWPPVVPAALLAAALLGPAARAEGLAASAAVPPVALAQAVLLAREAAAAVAPPDARIEVEPGTPDPRLRLAPCAQVQAVAAPGAPAWGRTRVNLRCAAGGTASAGPAGAGGWTIAWPMTVRVMAPAWVAAAPLPAGLSLTAAHLELKVVDWAGAAAPPFGAGLGDALLGRTLQRALPAGHAPRGTDLHQRRWFSVGQPVRVTVQGSGFAVSAQGLALSDGLEGRPARVRTDNGRVLTGMPVGQARMEVAL